MSHGRRQLQEPHAASEQRRLWILTVLGGLIVAIFLGLRDSVDVDVWLHLRIGDELRSGTRFGELPDPLVLLADRPYLPSQWLGEVVQSVVYEWSGFAGLHAMRVVGLFLLVVFVYLAARMFAPPVPAAGTTLFAVLATSGAWGERPQLAGLVLAAAAVVLWARAWTRAVTPWWVVPLTWLWACVHGTWILGLATGLLFSAAILWRHAEMRARWSELALVNGLSLVVVALTPLGPQLLAAPFTVGAYARATVSEWQVPPLTDPRLLIVYAMVALAIPGAVRRPGRGLEPLLIPASVVLAASAHRTVAFGALLAAPACASGLRWIIERGGAPRTATRGASKWMAATVALLLTGSALVDPPRTDPLQVDVATALEGLAAGSHVAVARRLSNWVVYRFRNLVPLQDLRAEVYSERTAAAYASFLKAEGDWRGYARDHDVRAIVVERESELARALRDAPGWRDVASEGGYGMWVPNLTGSQ